MVVIVMRGRSEVAGVARSGRTRNGGAHWRLRLVHDRSGFLQHCQASHSETLGSLHYLCQVALLDASLASVHEVQYGLQVSGVHVVEDKHGVHARSPLKHGREELAAGCQNKFMHWVKLAVTS